MFQQNSLSVDDYVCVYVCVCVCVNTNTNMKKEGIQKMSLFIVELFADIKCFGF